MNRWHRKSNITRVVCDRCGEWTYSDLCRMEWDNLFVCAKTCWEPRHPQDFLKAPRENIVPPIVRANNVTPPRPITVGGIVVNQDQINDLPVVNPYYTPNGQPPGK